MNHGSHRDQQQRAADDLPVNTPQVYPPFDAALDRKRQHRPDEQEEQREDEVLEMKALPAHVVELFADGHRDRIRPKLAQGAKDRVSTDEPKHVEPAQGVD